MELFEKTTWVKATLVEPLKGNTIGPPLLAGENYLIIDIYACRCGQQHIDVGLKSEYNYITCYTCQQMLPQGEKIHWCHPIRFEKTNRK